MPRGAEQMRQVQVDVGKGHWDHDAAQHLLRRCDRGLKMQQAPLKKHQRVCLLIREKKMQRAPLTEHLRVCPYLHRATESTEATTEV